jgi:ABC-type phosphate transport system substrate-binding protein
MTVPHLLLLFAIAITAALTPGASSAAKPAERIVVVANESVRVDTLEVVELQRIYLSKRTRWPDDTRIVATMLKDGPVHRSFVEDILDRGLSKFATYWKQIVFTGQGVPPKSFGSEEELLDYVARTPGAIGYISTRPRAEGVHIVALAP